MILSRFRRITRDGRWIPEIDGLRFVAIASVLLFHLAAELHLRSGALVYTEPRFWWVDRLLTNGDRGVRLFFVISGMILALPFARQMLLGTRPVSLKKYYLRRVTRLEPPFILAMLLALAMITVYTHGLPTAWLPHLLASLLYQHGLIYGGMSPFNPVTWSLEVEIQFYLLAPLAMQCFRLRGTWLRRGLMVAAIVAIGLAQAPFAAEPRFYGSILFYLQYFLAGLVVADVFVLDLEGIKSSAAWDAVGLAILGFFFWVGRDAYWPHVVLPVLVGLLCVSAMRGVLLRRFFANPLVAVVGGMCYSIYLMHFLLIAAVFKVTRRAILHGVSFPVNLGIQVLVTGVPVVLLCAVFFLLVERPCMDPDWPSHLWHWMTGRSGAEVEGLDTHLTSPGQEPTDSKAAAAPR